MSVSEEIDIIELLKRVKEGKAPKEIEIHSRKYKFDNNASDLACIYKDGNDCYLISEHIYSNTKIKILDKPIIEELKPVNYNNIVTYPDRDILTKKINEIIKFINEQN